MLSHFDGVLLFLGLLLPLLAIQRSLHGEIQAVFYLLTRRIELALALFAFLFFPGVLLHEGSHYLTARLLGVRTGRFSLIPRPLPRGRLQMGFVETGRADPLRDALIGLAPLVFGGAFVAYAGLARLGLGEALQTWRAGGIGAVLKIVPGLLARPDFWLWFYLTFTVSSTMLPSESDRRGWLAVLLFAGLLLGASLLAGAGPWLLANVAPALNRLFLAGSIALSISNLLHGILLMPVLLVRMLLSQLPRRV